MNESRPVTPARRRRLRLQARRGTSLLGAVALATVGLVASGVPARAVHAQDMQLDGNTSPTGISDPAYDWESFFTTDGNGDITERSTAMPTGFLARGKSVDYALPESSTFATGSKDTLNIGKSGKTAAGWQCGNSNNLGAKDDLVNVYTAAYRNPANNHLILYFGAEKSSNLGDNNIGIWFLQDSSVGCTVVNGHNTDFTGHHQDGDVLLTAAFTNGGTQATVESHAWEAGTANGGEGFLGAAEGGFLCHTPTSAELASPATDTSACAITNLSEFNPPWNHPLKTPGANGALATQEFYEGGVDVTQLEIDSGNTNTDPCITTFVADTRSSQSPTATLFDFALGSLPVCHPATSLSMSRSPATIHSGDSVTWTALETNTGTSVLDQVDVVDTASSSPCDFTYSSGDANNNGTLDPASGSDAAETWTFTCTETLTADKTLSAYGTGRDTISHKVVTGGPSSVCQFDDSKTPPTVTFQATGYICDPNERASASVDVIFPSTTLTNTAATVSPTIAHTGDTITYTFYEKNDGDVALTSPHVTTDDSVNCPDLTSPVSGDTNSNGKLDPGEEWAFQCLTSYSSTGTQTIKAVGHGTDPLGADVTFYEVSGANCTAGAIVSGKLCDLQERTSKSVTIINPGTTLRESVTAVVTFTYTEKNVGDSAITNPYVTSDCTGVDGSGDPIHATYISGDANTNGVLDPLETWTLRCTKTVSLPLGSATTSFSDTGTGYGTDAAGGAVPTTNEIDSSSVTLTNSAPNTAQ